MADRCVDWPRDLSWSQRTVSQEAGLGLVPCGCPAGALQEREESLQVGGLRLTWLRCAVAHCRRAFCDVAVNDASLSEGCR